MVLRPINFQSNGINIELFHDSLNLLNHRGPDDQDIYVGENFALGHRRLSIIDLDAHAKQPMISDCGQFVLVFNGEIYNYREIRESLVEKGHNFHTSSDTEVLLNAFIEYGIDCVELFIGMFAFSIFDKNNDEIYIVRDRLGIKPLFYYQNTNSFTFASEIKSILRLNQNKFQFNIEAVSSYLSFRYPILDDTFFEGIYSLPPAHYIKVSDQKISKVEYWNASHKFKEQNDYGEEYYINKTRELLESKCT